jgi:hypothetical protein
MKSVGNTPPGSDTSSLYTAPGYQQAVFLDSGATFSQLPEEIVNEIVSAFPGAYLVGTSSPQYYVVDCKYASADGTVDFGFGGTVINVPYHQFIWQSGGFCFLGVVATVPSDVTWILGGLSLNAPRNGGYWLDIQILFFAPLLLCTIKGIATFWLQTLPAVDSTWWLLGLELMLYLLSQASAHRARKLCGFPPRALQLKARPTLQQLLE